MTVDTRPLECDAISTCRTCEGHGERGTKQDHWGNWESETCPDCQGTGQTDDRCSECKEPTLADELVALDGQEVCVPCLVALTGDDPYAPDNARDLGSVTAATVLIALIFGGLAFLAALAYGQQALCAVNGQQAHSYCPGFEAQQ